MSKVLIKGGRVINPLNRVDDIRDVLIENGRIKKVDKGISVSADKVINADNLIVCPGLIDIHVHLREPGREDEETVETGTRAAVKGGFTTVACMPNTEPVADSAAVIEYIKEKARSNALARVLPIGALTKELKGEELSPMNELIEAGVIAFSNDGESVMDAEVMRRALEYSKMFDVPVIVHAEDKQLSVNGQINEGLYSTVLGLKGIPAAAEEVIIARDLILAKMTGAKIHFAHVSTRGSVELIRRAKEEGINVTCEVTPHHLTLTDAMIESYDSNYKVNPPLRSEIDVLALREGLKNGTIDAIASDHAPHALHEKEREFQFAPFGVIGLETTLPLVLTELVEARELSLLSLVEKLTINPAKILGLDLGTLSEGSAADITIIDNKAKVKVDINNFQSKSKNSPFHGWVLNGKVSCLIANGKVVVEDGNSIIPCKEGV